MTNQLTPKEVRRWRKAAGMTQPEFAEMLGLSRPTIARWETDGETDIPRWTGFARAGWESLMKAKADPEMHEGKLKIYRFQKWDIVSDRYVQSKRMAMRFAIEQRGCEVIEDSGILVNRDAVDAEGMLKPEWHAPLGLGPAKGVDQLERIIARFDCVSPLNNTALGMPTASTECFDAGDFVSTANANGWVFVQQGHYEKPIVDGCGRSIQWTHYLDLCVAKGPMAPAVRYLLGNRR